jgi:Holliday junction resolvase
MSKLPPDEPSIAGADAGGRKAVAHEARGAPETDQLGRVNRENSLASGTVEGQRGGRRSRAKGDRIEREIVSRHAAIGIKAERYPLSGATRFRGSGHDIDIYAFGTDEGPLVAEVKSRRSGAGFVTLEKWLGEYDCLFLRRNSAEPMVLLPWRVWVALLARVRR